MFVLALICVLACGPSARRNLLEAGEVLSQVRIQKIEEKEIPFTLRFDRIRQGGVAWNAGFRDGDFLLSVNAVPVYSWEGGVRLLSRVDADSPTVIKLKRGQEVVRIELPAG